MVRDLTPYDRKPSVGLAVLLLVGGLGVVRSFTVAWTSNGLRGVIGLALLVFAVVGAQRVWRRVADARQRGWAVFEASPVGQVELDRKLRVIHANAAFTALVGRSLEALIGVHAPSLFHSDSPPSDLAVAAELLAGTRERARGERLLQGPDGLPVPVQLELAPVRRRGEVLGLAAAVTDLTEQTAAREHLRHARERSETLFARSPIGLIEADHEGRIVRTNDALRRMLGYSAEELAGSNGLMLHADPRNGRDGLRRLAGGSEYAEQRRYRRRDGTEMPALVVTAMLRDGHGAPDGFAAFVVDTSELVAQRETIERREALLTSVLDTVDVGIMVRWRDGTVLRNRAHRAFYGLPQERATSAFVAPDPMVDLLTPEGERIPAEQWPLARALRGEDVGVVPLRVGPRGGPHREVVTRTCLITSEDGDVRGAVLAMTDVSALAHTTQELARERARLVQAQRVGRVGSFSYAPLEDAWWLSPQLLALWGQDTALPWPQLRLGIVEPDRAAVGAALKRAVETGGRHETVFGIIRASDGEQRWLRAVVEVERDAQGRAIMLTGTHQDVTEQVRAERAVADERQRLEAILSASPDYTYVRDLPSGRVVFSSDRPLAGHDPSEHRQTALERIYDHVHPDDLPALRAADVAVLGLADGQEEQVRYRLRGTDGSWHWIRRNTTPFARDPHTGEVVEVLGVARDVSEVVDHEERLTHAATHDLLTGLPNRARLADRLQESLGRSQRNGGRVAVLFCDLDGFKAVNDTAGHGAGDAVLVEVAARLRAAVRSDALVSRVGGDEFVIVVEDLREGVDAVLMALADRLVEVVRRPVIVDGTAHRVSASLGLAISWPGDTADVLLDRADAAMYSAKRDGKNRAANLLTPRKAADDDIARQRTG